MERTDETAIHEKRENHWINCEYSVRDIANDALHQRTIRHCTHTHTYIYIFIESELKSTQTTDTDTTTRTESLSTERERERERVTYLQSQRR